MRQKNLIDIQQPYLLQQVIQVHTEGRMRPERYFSANLHALKKPGMLHRVLFAYRIPYLVDQLISLHLTGSTEQERLTEVFNQHVRLITNLSRYKDMAFALRFHADPNIGEIKIALVVRVLSSAPQQVDFYQHLAFDIASVFKSFDYLLEPVLTESDLGEILLPISDPMILEIRQHEEIAAMLYGGAYIVYPFHPRPTTLVTVCRAMLQQTSPSVVSIYLEPTQLYKFERENFSRAAQLAETLADVQYEGYITKGRIVDPIARVVGRLYGNYVQRLRDPFLLVVQVASPNLLTAQSVAQAFAAEMTEIRPISEAVQSDAILPSGYDIAVPHNSTELEKARQTFMELELFHWGTNIATEGKERLRYLVDAHTAASAFRFPVAVRGGIPGIRTRQVPPSYYDIGSHGDKVQDTVMIGEFIGRRGLALAPVSSFSRHVLIAGTTGSGKTTTAMHLLSQLWEKYGIPFLVIEPAKKEYRALMDSPLGQDLQVFTLGDESVSPFRLNPLEIFPGVRVETHISHLRASFEAALPTFGILPSLIEEALYNVYFKKGWELTERGRDPSPHLMPTLGELYFEIIHATEQRGYSDRTLQDIRAAAAGRIGSLLRGSKGRMLNTRRSIPINRLMTKPTLLELEALNDEEKALVIMFLLTAIREYCLTTRDNSSLQHVMLIEEAHRIMSDVGHATNREVSADTRAQAVSMFSDMLSEIRAFGEGIIIAEQIPSRLAEDALKNTNIKIVHRLPGRDDREILGGAMNLEPEQEKFLSKLQAGQAALFMEGYERATFVRVPNYKNRYQLPGRVSDQRVRDAMVPFWTREKDLLLPFDGCRYCQKICRYRDRVATVAYETATRREFQKALWEFEKSIHQGKEEQGWVKLVETCQKTVAGIGLGDDRNAAYCFFTHLWEYEVTQTMHKRFWVSWED